MVNNGFTTKSDYVCDILKKRITEGKYQQGESLNISKIADEFDMSIIPVREALKRLEMEGLVNIIPHKGAQVTTFDKETISEIIEIRAVLEGYAARTAIPNFDDEKIQHLESMIGKMDEYILKNDDESYANANKEFHKYLYKQSPLSRLYDMIVNLWDGGRPTSAIFAFIPGRMEESQKEHYQILKALKDKDGEKLERIIRDHKTRNIHLWEKINKK